MQDALAWAVGIVTPQEIDKINIRHASFLAMHRALDQLSVRPEAILVDGNRFDAYVVGKGLPGEGTTLPHTCVVKGDGKYQTIAAASILAKTFRDDYMREMAAQYPYYDWEHNVGYPTKKHRMGILTHGISPLHRKSFQLIAEPDLFQNQP